MRNSRKGKTSNSKDEMEIMSLKTINTVQRENYANCFHDAMRQCNKTLKTFWCQRPVV